MTSKIRHLLLFSLVLVQLSCFLQVATAQQQTPLSAQNQRHNFGIASFDSIVSDPILYGRTLEKMVKGVVRPSYEESVIAYYGFAFQKGYVSDRDGVSSTENLMQQAIMSGDFETAYTLGVEILKLKPVDLTALYWTLYAATEIKQPWEERNVLRGRYNSLCYVISRSGLGLSQEDAFRTVYMGDMYTYCTMELGLIITSKRMVWDGRWVQFEVEPSQRFKHGNIFFDGEIPFGINN